MSLSQIHSRVKELVSRGNYKDALSLVEHQSSSGRHAVGSAVEELERARLLNELHTKYAYDLFSKGEYAEAMVQFQLTDSDPLLILSLFPDVLPSSLPAALPPLPP